MPDKTDDAVLKQIGGRLGAVRLSLNLTQAELAHSAGVSKSTVERMEAGQSVQMTSYIRLLRALNLLEGMLSSLPEPQPGPMELLRRDGKKPQRARRSKPSKSAPWTWGDES